MARRTKAHSSTSSTPPAAPVRVRHTRDTSWRTAAAWAVAEELAAGDRGRLDYVSPGVVVVRNAAAHT